jgi:murein L,D-transpeptidase YcbB/YkuD
VNTFRRITLLSLTVIAAACHAGPRTSGTSAAADPTIAATVDTKTTPAFVGHDDSAHHVWQEERRFYRQNGEHLVWSDGRRLRPQADGLLRAVRAADQEGLNPADYHVDAIAAHLQSFDVAHGADVDLELTYAYLSYAWDLTHGTSDPEDLDPHWHAVPRNVDLHAALQNGLDENRIEESLQRLAPSAPQYQGLKHQLALLRAMAAQNTSSVPSTVPNAAGAANRPNPASSSNPASSANRANAANLDNAARIRAIAINMDRWRWLPDDLGSRYVIVNIPAFHLDVVENGRSVLGMGVVAGKPNSPTPVLADRMEYIVFSPYWNIPPDIVQKEMLPHEMKDPGYLERNNIEVVRVGSNDTTPVDPANVDWNAGNLRFRQRPGKGNSLGFVKFVFPNHFNVYMHDTPAQALFERIERDFSHGCIRLEKPKELAKYVLRDQPEWTDERIEQAMHAGTERSVPLKQPLPVYLVYFTAWEQDGAVQFGNDVYGYDRKHSRVD